MKIYNITLLSCLLISASSALAGTLPEQANISVSGAAKIEVKPDIVEVEFQSSALENDANSAKQVVDKQVQMVISKLAENGFEQSRLTRADIQLRPQYEYIEKKRTQVGIKATRNLSYKLQDVTKLNSFLQILVKADISNIGQIKYALKDPVEWQLKARDLAVKDSINKARGLANSYEAKLGTIYSINYQSNQTSASPMLMRTMETGQTAPSYQNNQIVINENVNAVFLLEP